MTPKRSAADPVAGGEGWTIFADREWYIAKTAPRMSERAIKGLDAKGVVVIQPLTSEIVERGGRRLVRRRQFLLRTVFIGVHDASHLERARMVAGVAEIMSVPREDPTAVGNVEGMVMRPARLKAVDLQRFVDALASDEVVQPFGVKEGDLVILRSGPFASFPAIVEQILPNEMVKVAVSIFGRVTPYELPLAQVERVT